MDEITELKIKNLESKVEILERKNEENEKRINEFDKTQEVIMLQIDNLSQQLTRVEEKTDQLLKSKTSASELTEEKAKNYDKLKWIIISEAIAIIALIVKGFMKL